jgi:HAMP domain-containing protein
MRRPIRVRTFILSSVLVLLVVPVLVGGAAWLIERDRQQADTQRRLNTAVAYLTTHRTDLKASLPGFASLLERLDLLADLSLRATTPAGKGELYLSPTLQQAGVRGSDALAATAGAATTSSWSHHQQLIPAAWSGSDTTLVADLYFRPASGAARTIVALVSGIIVLFAGVAVAVWLAGRWMVKPLTRLSSQVDKVAGGDLAISVPRSRIGEITSGGNTFEIDNDRELSVIVDRDRLKRALTNILDNAVRHSPAGAPIDLSWCPSRERA